MRRNTKRDRTIAVVLLLLATLLLVASLFASWWTIEGVGEGVTDSMSFGFPATNGGNGVSYACSGGEICPSADSYSNLGFNSTGNLYSMIQYLTIGATFLGLLGALLAFGTRFRPSWTAPAILLILVALILALVAPVVLTISQPGAIQNDGGARFAGTNGTNPSNSFWGSSSSGTGNFTVTYTWGATTGWLLSLLAFLLFSVGLIVLARTRHSTPVDSSMEEATPVPPPLDPEEPESPSPAPPDQEAALPNPRFQIPRTRSSRPASVLRAKFFKERSGWTG